MNEYVIESFISFCDDMMIAEEKFNFQTAMNMVGKVINQVITFIKSIPGRISQFISKKFRGNTNSPEYKVTVEKAKKVNDSVKEATDKLTECNNKMNEMKRINDENMSKLDQLQKQAESIAQSVINSTKSVDSSLQSELQNYYNKSYATA